jgi:hypothetical protein
VPATRLVFRDGSALLCRITSRADRCSGRHLVRRCRLEQPHLPAEDLVLHGSSRGASVVELAIRDSHARSGDMHALGMEGEGAGTHTLKEATAAGGHAHPGVPATLLADRWRRRDPVRRANTRPSVDVVQLCFLVPVIGCWPAFSQSDVDRARRARANPECVEPAVGEIGQGRARRAGQGVSMMRVRRRMERYVRRGRVGRPVFAG